MAEIGLDLLLSVHLLLVDVAMAGPLACVALGWSKTPSGEALAGRVGRALAGLSIAALVAGAVVGGVLLGLRDWLDDRAYLAALAAIPPSRLWFGGAELLFSLTVMVAYRALWDRRARWRDVHPVLALAAGTNLLVHFPALFVIVAVLAERGVAGVAPLDSAEYRQLLVDGEVVARVIHVWLAASAVTAVAVVALARRVADEGDSENRQRIARRAGLVAASAVILEIPSGLYVAWQMSETAQRMLFGGDPLAAGLLVASIALAFWLLHVLGAVALGDSDPTQFRRAVVLLLLLVLCMVATRMHVYNRLQASAAIPTTKSLAKWRSL